MHACMSKADLVMALGSVESGDLESAGIVQWGQMPLILAGRCHVKIGYNCCQSSLFFKDKSASAFLCIIL